MNKFICVGTKVTNGRKKGTVINIDRKSKIAVMQGTACVWTDKTSKLQVTSYR